MNNRLHPSESSSRCRRRTKNILFRKGDGRDVLHRSVIVVGSQNLVILVKRIERGKRSLKEIKTLFRDGKPMIDIGGQKLLHRSASKESKGNSSFRATFPFFKGTGHESKKISAESLGRR